MTIKIPKKGEKAEWIRPFDVDGDTSKYNTPDIKPVINPVINPVQPQASSLTIANINPREYIQVGMNGLNGTPVVISAYELQGSNNKNYEDAHKFVLKQGLYVPTPKIFMIHFRKVINAAKGNGTLRYADGSFVTNSEIEEMYKHLTTNYKDIFGKGYPGAWTWLNGRFVEGTGCLSLDLETITGLNQDDTLRTDTEPLENCLNKDIFVEPIFNRQGFPKSIHNSQTYLAGENIKFWYPRKGSVARFYAGSDGAYLDCYWYPTNTNPSLGVFGCAEGAGSPKNSTSVNINNLE